MVEDSVVRIVATLAENTVIITDAPCRGVNAGNTSCLSRVEFGNWHGGDSLGQRWTRLIVFGWSDRTRYGPVEPLLAFFPIGVGEREAPDVGRSQ